MKKQASIIPILMLLFLHVVQYCVWFHANLEIGKCLGCQVHFTALDGVSQGASIIILTVRF